MEFGNCAGMTQLSFNCEETEYDDAVIHFDTDEDDEAMDVRTGKRLSAHERCNPVCKEIFNRLDRLGEDATEEWLSRILNDLNLLDQRVAAELPQPKGTIVSCLSANPRAPSKHKKQT